MNKIKALAVCLVIGLGSLAYASGSAQTNAAARGCDTNQAQASCCAPGASCCTGGSCCMAKIAK